MLTLDGAGGEGGGQILRSSLALALLTGQSFQLRRIRGGRANPGLRPQHLMCVNAAARIGQAQIEGAALGSRNLVFEPGQIVPGTYDFRIRTAGAISLVQHTIYLPLALRASLPSQVTITGGTHVTKSPCFHFMDVTWRSYMEQIGLRLAMRMDVPGFYPHGGGVVEMQIQPCSGLSGLRLEEREAVTSATILSASESLPEHVARRQANQAAKRLEKCGLQLSIRTEEWPGERPGSLLAIILHSQPVPTVFFGLGALGKPSERVADEAADQAIVFLDAKKGIDPHSADQLVLPLALADEPSTFTVSEVTSHLLTNIAVIRRFLDRDIVCEGEEGEPGTVCIR
jgi:RNA 3'-phosphate cyclase